jgi:hypothetical protein
MTLFKVIKNWCHLRHRQYVRDALTHRLDTNRAHLTLEQQLSVPRESHVVARVTYIPWTVHRK